MFKKHLDIFLSGIPDQPTVTGLGRAASSNSLLQMFSPLPPPSIPVQSDKYALCSVPPHYALILGTRGEGGVFKKGFTNFV